MSRKEGEGLAQLRKDLKKNMDNETVLLDVLRSVASAVVTRELLKSTGIGKTINKLAGDERPKVAAAAKPILKSWKEATKAKHSAPGTMPTLDRSISSASSGSLFNEKTPEAAAKAAKAAEPSAASAKSAESVSEASGSALERIPQPVDPKRAKTCQLLQQLFKDEEDRFGKAAVANVAAHIERAMANALVASSADYKSKYRTLKYNLNQNKKLKVDLLEGKLLAARLVTMTDAELLSQDRIEQIKLDNEEKLAGSRQDWLDEERANIMEKLGVKQGGVFTCGRCGSSKTTYYEKQTRSADEPMTVFIQCTECPNRWRQ